MFLGSRVQVHHDVLTRAPAEISGFSVKKIEIQGRVTQNGLRLKLGGVEGLGRWVASWILQGSGREFPTSCGCALVAGQPKRRLAKLNLPARNIYESLPNATL